MVTRGHLVGPMHGHMVGPCSCTSQAALITAVIASAALTHSTCDGVRPFLAFIQGRTRQSYETPRTNGKVKATQSYKESIFQLSRLLSGLLACFS